MTQHKPGETSPCPACGGRLMFIGPGPSDWVHTRIGAPPGACDPPPPAPADPGTLDELAERLAVELLAGYPSHDVRITQAEAVLVIEAAQKLRDAARGGAP